MRLPLGKSSAMTDEVRISENAILATMPDRSSANGTTGAASLDLGSVGGYRLLQLLGEGDKGRVYRAEEISTGKQTALKLIKPAHSGDEFARQRLVREAQRAAQIDHPNVAAIEHVGQDAKQVFLVMPL